MNCNLIIDMERSW